MPTAVVGAAGPDGVVLRAALALAALRCREREPIAEACALAGVETVVSPLPPPRLRMCPRPHCPHPSTMNRYRQVVFLVRIRHRLETLIASDQEGGLFCGS